MKMPPSEVCSVSGLPIYGRPEWTDISFGKNYRVTIRLLGDRVIYSKPSGHATRFDVENVLKLLNKIIIESFPKNRRYVQIEDYTNLSGVTLNGRKCYIDYIKNRKHLYELIFCGTSPMFKMSIKLGKRLNIVNFNVKIVKDYPEAVSLALQTSVALDPLSHDTTVNVMGMDAYVKKSPALEVIAEDDWFFQMDGFSARFEIIDGHIFHADTSGFLEAHHLEPLFRAHEKIFNTFRLPQGSYYFIGGVKGVKGSRKARSLYYDHVMQWYKIHPFRMYIFYGANRFLRAAINLASPLAPFPVRMLKDFTTTLNFIAHDKSETAESTFRQAHGVALNEPFAMHQARQYGDELLQFLGSINWEASGYEAGSEISDSHPFKPVFDAIALIKMDLDDLSQERQKAVEDLRKNEEKYRSILKSIEEGYYEVDLAGNFTFFNNAMCKIIGFSEDEMFGMKTRHFMDQENAKKVAQTFSRVNKTGKSEKGSNWEFIRKDGRKLNIESSVLLIKDDDDQPVGFRGILKDVSERVQSAKMLHAANEELEAINLELEKSIERSNQMAIQSEIEYQELNQIVNASADGMWVIDSEFNVIRINKALSDLLGTKPEDAIGRKCHEIFSDALCRSPKCPLIKIKKGEQRVECEVEKENKDGLKVTLMLAATPLGETGEEVTGIVVNLTDISLRYRAEALEQEKIRAEASDKAKSEFLANMSHEIRTPLNGIIGMSELGLDAHQNDNPKEIFHTINSEAGSLLNIINDILDFSKVEAGKLELEEIPFDLRIMLEDMANTLAHRAAQKGLELISFLAPGVPSRLIGDPGRLRQILTNLIGNALKFTHEGEIYIKGEMVEDLGDKAKFRIIVKDSGIGIPKEKQPAIFESFTQADGSTTRKYGGTGLGTTISKQLAELMGGEIGFESQEGKGSTFWFTVLFKKQMEPKTISLKQNPMLKNLRVLAVDHNQTNRHILVEYLKSWGCRPVAASDGREALDILRESVSLKDPFNLVLTNFQMPEMSGFDLTTAIREIDALKNMSIIVLTSVGRKGDGKRCKELGIKGYLTKPIRRDDLPKVIGSVLDLTTEDEALKGPQLITRHSIAEAAGKKTRILLSEDYPTNRRVAQQYLHRAGYQVDIAENGQMALEAFKRKQYDLILMDIQMPVMDGYEATKAIRELEKELWRIGTKDASSKPGKIPIIAMTAHAMKGYREKCLKAGMDDYISKPIQRDKLLELVRKWAQPGSNSEMHPAESEAGFSADTEAETIVDFDCGVDKNNAPMDFHRAVQEFEGDKELVLDLLDGFLEDVRTQIETIRQGISGGDAEIVRKEAHSIKGGSANLTAYDLSSIAFELENIGRSGALEEGAGVLEKLENEFRSLETFAGGMQSD